AKLRQRQVRREASAAVPDGVSGCCSMVGQSDCVSGYLVRVDGAVAQSDKDADGTEPGEEVGLVDCRRSGCPYIAAEPVPRHFGASLPSGLVLLGGIGPVMAGAVCRADAEQSVAFFQVACCGLGLDPLVP